LLLARVKQGHLDRVKGHQRVILLLETFPQSTDLWIARATLDRNSGDIESAIQALKRARELAPSNKFLEQMLNELQEQAPRTRNERSSSHG
jgi:predicted Zn-dependent protease